MESAFWKLSMAGDDFPSLLDVLDWVRRGVVLVHKDTRPKGKSDVSQGTNFVDAERLGDYFYLCHGNHEPAVLLLGQFVGPPDLFCERGGGWAERPFKWIHTSTNTKPYNGQAKWWAPNHNSTFTRVPDAELAEFESGILVPYFDLQLSDFGIMVDG
jgi:hypothetical protein